MSRLVHLRAIVVPMLMVLDRAVAWTDKNLASLIDMLLAEGHRDLSTTEVWETSFASTMEALSL